MPVLPDVGSTISVFLLIRPSRSAASIINPDSVLDGTEWVEELTFDQNLGVDPRGDAVEPHQRRATDGFGDVIKNLAHVCLAGNFG